MVVVVMPPAPHVHVDFPDFPIAVFHELLAERFGAEFIPFFIRKQRALHCQEQQCRQRSAAPQERAPEPVTHLHQIRAACDPGKPAQRQK